MNRKDIITAANTKSIFIHIHPTNGTIDKVKAKLSGRCLDFPYIVADDGRNFVSFAINWKLAERLATGETNHVTV